MGVERVLESMVLVGTPPNLAVEPPPSTRPAPLPLGALSSTLQRPHLLAFFGGSQVIEPGSSGQKARRKGAGGVDALAQKQHSGLKEHMAGLRDQTRRVGMKSQFVRRATTAVFVRKVSTTLATFLPTGLLRQLSSAVLDGGVNPRLPEQCPGVYVVFSMAGLHALPEFPIDAAEVEARVRHVYEVIAGRIHEDGGQVVKLTADACIACWALKPNTAASSGGGGGGKVAGSLSNADLRGEAKEGVDGGASAALGPTKVSAFQPQQVRAAAHAAGTAALSIIKELHGHLLWANEAYEAHLRATGGGIATDGGESTRCSTAFAASEEGGAGGDGRGGGGDAIGGAPEGAEPGGEEASKGGDASSPGDERRGTLGGLMSRGGKWGGAKGLLAKKAKKGLLHGSTAAIARGDTKDSGPTGLSFLDAVKAANKAAEEGGGFAHRLEMGAALTISAAQAMHVGGSNGRWEYVVCAPELSAAQHILAEVAGAGGEVLVAEDLSAAFPLGTLQQHMATDAWWLLADADDLHPANADIEKARRFELVQALPAAAMRAYVPASMWASVHAGNPERIVTLAEQVCQTTPPPPSFPPSPDEPHLPIVLCPLDLSLHGKMSGPRHDPHHPHVGPAVSTAARSSGCIHCLHRRPSALPLPALWHVQAHGCVVIMIFRSPSCSFCVIRILNLCSSVDCAVQDHAGGCTAAVLFGAHPYEHSEVNCSRGALAVAIEVRAHLRQIGIRSHAAIKTGRLWTGSVGADSRHEYVAVGEPLQLCSQMLGFTDDEAPILVDGTCCSANKQKYNFHALPVQIRMPSQLKQHTMYVVDEPRSEDERLLELRKPTGFTTEQMMHVTDWLKTHQKHMQTAVVAGQLSEAAKFMMTECFKELDRDKSGTVDAKELLEAVEEVDMFEADDPRSVCARDA